MVVNGIRLASILVVLALAACSQEDPALGRLNAVDADAVEANNRGVALMGRFDFQAAESTFAKLSAEYPLVSEFRFNRAVALMNRQKEGDEGAAMAILEKILADRPQDLDARYTAALLLLRDGETTRALQLLEAVTEADPTDAYAAYFLGQAWESVGDTERAMEAYRRVVRLEPYLRSAYYAMMMIQRRQGRNEEARTFLERFRDLSGNPKARQVEFKYTRMGPRSEVVTVDRVTARKHIPPRGPLFAPRRELGRLLAVPGNASAQNITVADINGDDILDLFISEPTQVLLGVSGGTFAPSPGHALSGLEGVNMALWGDVDNDGLLDVYLCRQGANHLWRQTAPGSWQELSAPALAAGGGYDTVDGALFDADHDGDLDLFLVNADGPNELLNNNLDGTFRSIAKQAGIAGDGRPSRSVLVLDLDRDRDSDLVVVNAQPPHELYLNERSWRYRVGALPEAFAQARVEALVAGDLDVDGRPEIYALTEPGMLERWRHDGQTWSHTPLGSGGGSGGRKAAPLLALIDFRGDGRPQLVVADGSGWEVLAIEAAGAKRLDRRALEGHAAWAAVLERPRDGPSVVALNREGRLVLWSPGAGRFDFTAVRFSGKTDGAEQMRSNASGIGVAAALRVGSRWSAIQGVRDHAGPGQGLQPTALGLGGAERADFLRLTWSDGVFQTEMDLEAGRVHSIEETKRQLSSCPVLFVWDGAQYAFVSDLLGVGGLGYAIGPEEYAEPRPWENFLLPEGVIRPRQGRFALKITEPMEEVAYLDAARLVAYDLPPGWDMVLDERMGIGGPPPTGRPLFFREQMLPIRAQNGRGDEVTASIAEADGQAAPLGPVDRRFIGLLQGEEILMLGFPAPLDSAEGTPVLVADGWVDYPYSQTSFAAWQAGATFEAPTLEARRADGRWQVLRARFGYPAGMPRRMALPLPDVPRGSRQLRLRGTMEVYWDHIALAYARPLPEARRRQLGLARAEIRQTGFPLRTTLAQRLPRYDYQRRSPLWDTRHQEGFYTQFGAADPLIEAVDDAVAVIGPGEELHLEFEAAPQDPPAGWKRRFVLQVNGWTKDMDLYTGDGEAVEPLPRRAAQSPRAKTLHDRYNTRFAAGY